MLARKIFRALYYAVYGKSGKEIIINNELYTVSAYVARGIQNTIDEVPLKVLKNVCKDANLVFDIGANIGAIATIVSKHMKSGTIYSFEPAPSTFKILTDMARVQKGNAVIKPYPYAIGEAKGALLFTNDPGSAENHITDKEGMNVVSVDVVAIDDFCKKHNLVPDVIKIDVEGAEYMALKGMVNTLKNNDCKVVLEIHSVPLKESGVSSEQFAALIEQTSYKPYDIKGNVIAANEIYDNACIVLSKKEPEKYIFNFKH